MAANVETIFWAGRQKPWHGLGTRIVEASCLKEALSMAGLDWKVTQEPIYTETEELIKGYKANVRDSDRHILGVVSNRYKIVQNEEAFAFTDELLKEGIRFEAGGHFQKGRRTWLLCRMPREYFILGERISPYLLFSNSHDGSGAIKVSILALRVLCMNSLNLALSGAKRSWAVVHVGAVKEKIKEARDTIFMTEQYMDALGKEFELLRRQTITEKEVLNYIEMLLPIEDNATSQQSRNIQRLREDMKRCYFEAPDLKGLGNNFYRLVNSVSDFATHAEPLRKTANYRENLFIRTVEGNPLIDRAYQMIKAA